MAPVSTAGVAVIVSPTQALQSSVAATSETIVSASNTVQTTPTESTAASPSATAAVTVQPSETVTPPVTTSAVTTAKVTPAGPVSTDIELTTFTAVQNNPPVFYPNNSVSMTFGITLRNGGSSDVQSNPSGNFDFVVFLANSSQPANTPAPGQVSVRVTSAVDGTTAVAQGEVTVLAAEATLNTLTTSNCVEMTHVCLRMLVTGNFTDTDAANNDQCLAFGSETGQVGTKDCTKLVGSCSVTCHAKASCLLLPGTGVGVCICQSGYTGDGANCSDVNECTSNTANCAADRVCRNTEGSFSCDCKPGFTESGGTCEETQTYSAAVRITNEVFDSSLNDPTSTRFVALKSQVTTVFVILYTKALGPEFVSVTVTGFTNGSVVANHVVNTNKSSNATASSIGSSLQNAISSSPNLPFTVGGVQVTDFDECASSTTNDCSQYANCTNTPGSFTCVCRQGFQDRQPANPGRACGAECPAGYCKNGGTCQPVAGGLKCTCPSGYSGARCEDDGSRYRLTLGLGIFAGVLGALMLLACMVSAYISNKKKKSKELWVHPTKAPTKKSAMHESVPTFNPIYDESYEYTNKAFQLDDSTMARPPVTLPRYSLTSPRYKGDIPLYDGGYTSSTYDRPTRIYEVPPEQGYAYDDAEYAAINPTYTLPTEAMMSTGDSFNQPAEYTTYEPQAAINQNREATVKSSKNGRVQTAKLTFK
ncbi:NOTCH4 [Branchiostoma lanceolatum]|uniref:NOTCH4 protein n=1 Tax=Branchiostoma lanceolatum TaxID=7740 RepID=A0A8K0ER55_BRALA|nr:NOTCH4 [Branchiostoma lanceolatum]